MKRKLNILTFLYMLFLLLLFLSGSFQGAFSSVIYFLAFGLPIGIGIYLSREDKVDNILGITREKVGFTLPLIMPTVSVVIMLSILTSLVIFALTGRTNEVDVGDSFILAIISHALLPALLEEMLFRYLPIRMLSHRSPALTVFASAFFFALVHHDLFSIPYAFVAGAVFMAVDLATGSVIPSIIIHFINNALSVGIIMFGDNPVFTLILYSIIGILAVVSLIFIVKKRGEYKKALTSVLDKGEGIMITGEMLIFALMTLVIAVTSLI